MAHESDQDTNLNPESPIGGDDIDCKIFISDNENFWTAPGDALYDAASAVSEDSRLGRHIQYLCHSDPMFFRKKNVVDASTRVGCTYCGRIIPTDKLLWDNSYTYQPELSECPFCHNDEFICDAGGLLKFTDAELHDYSQAGIEDRTADEQWLVKNGMGGYTTDRGLDAARHQMNVADIADFFWWLKLRSDRIAWRAGDMMTGFATGWTCDDRSVLLARFSKSYTNYDFDDMVIKFYFVPVPVAMLDEYINERNQGDNDGK